MKKKIVIIILALIILLVAVIAYKALVVKEKMSTVLPQEIVETFGEKAFPGPNWGLKSIVCKQGGYDILSYAGKEVTIESSLAVGKFYQGTPLNLYKIYSGGKVICEYYAVSVGSLTPGIFTINDPNITSQ